MVRGIVFIAHIMLVVVGCNTTLKEDAQVKVDSTENVLMPSWDNHKKDTDYFAGSATIRFVESTDVSDMLKRKATSRSDFKYCGPIYSTSVLWEPHGKSRVEYYKIEDDSLLYNFADSVSWQVMTPANDGIDTNDYSLWPVYIDGKLIDTIK